MDKLSEIILAASRSFRETYIETRHPYTYAYDFLRSHPEIVPAEYVEEYFSGSRALTAGVVDRWSAGEGIDHHGLLLVLADAYMEEHHIYLD